MNTVISKKLLLSSFLFINLFQQVQSGDLSLVNNKEDNPFDKNSFSKTLDYNNFTYLSLNNELEEITLEKNFLDGFELYSGLDGLYSAFSNETILLIFWLHFLSISLFVGAWIVRDGRKYFVPRVIIIPSLILTYFTGPVVLVTYWFLRIFFAKKISFND